MHTREPWSHHEDYGRHWISAGRDIQIADVTDIEVSTGRGEVDTDAEQTAANARRIVACVNACAGITTEALESGALKKLIKAAEILSTDRTKVTT